MTIEMNGICILFLLLLRCLGEIHVDLETSSFQVNGSFYKVINGDSSQKINYREADEQCQAQVETVKGKKGGLTIIDNSEEMVIASEISQNYYIIPKQLECIILEDKMYFTN